MASQCSFQFVQEEGHVESNGQASMTSMQSSIPSSRMRRTKKEIEAALQTTLLSVFNVLTNNQLSLHEFLIAMFSS